MRAAAVAIAIVLSLAVAGCHRRNSNSTVVVSAGIFTTDEFPGRPVQDNNVADDRRAMSPSGASVTSLRVVQNGTRGTVMVVYGVMGGGLYAQHFDGESWTPPVRLQAADEDDSTVQADRTLIAFLNTADHSVETARDRDGDVIIVWQAQDLASGSGDVQNICLFSTYFNSSRRDDPAADYGFQLPADRISTLEDDGAGIFTEDVVISGLVSDGLCGEARFDQGGPAYGWGDPTSGLAAVWLQAEDNDPATPGMQLDRYWAWAAWDLSQPGDPELPLLPGPATRGSMLGFGASDSGLQSEETFIADSFVAYNNTLFVKAFTKADAGSAVGYAPVSAPFWGFLDAGVDTTIQVIAFDLAGATALAPQTLQVVPPDSSVGESHECSAAFLEQSGMFGGSFLTSRDTVYGPDEGLAATVIYSAQLVDDDDSTFGEVAADGRLALSEIDPETGVVTSTVFLDAEDPGIDDSVVCNRFTARIGRNGDYIEAGFMKRADGGVAGPSAEDYFAAWLTEYVPARLVDGAAPPSPPALAARVSAPILASEEIVGGLDVPGGFRFQQGLGYVCGIQSDPDVMNFFFEHSDTTHDEIFHVRLVADLDPLGGIAPTAIVSSFAALREGTLFPWEFCDADSCGFSAADAGSGGEAIAFFIDDLATTATTDYHLFAKRTGSGSGATQIDSSDGLKQCQLPSEPVKIIATPRGEEIGAFDAATGEDDPQRAHPGSRVDVLFFEDAIQHFDFLPRAVRTRRFDASDPAASTGEAFVPPAGASFEPPFDLGVPGLEGSIANVRPVDGGDVAGVWFTEDDRLYYQEAGDEEGAVPWHLDENGASDPFLVDDDIKESLLVFYGVFPQTCGCDSLHGAWAFWSSNPGGSSQNRLRGRKRDD